MPIKEGNLTRPDSYGKGEFSPEQRQLKMREEFARESSTGTSSPVIIAILMVALIALVVYRPDLLFHLFDVISEFIFN